MARPKKCRRICSKPEFHAFCPVGTYHDVVTMSFDEFEVIRLLDQEGLTQEQCARQMNVARATVTLIYDTARKKIADVIVNSKKLIIDGGDVTVCENADHCCGRCGKGNCASCEKLDCPNK